MQQILLILAAAVLSVVAMAAFPKCHDAPDPYFLQQTETTFSDAVAQLIADGSTVTFSGMETVTMVVDTVNHRVFRDTLWSDHGSNVSNREQIWDFYNGEGTMLCFQEESGHCECIPNLPDVVWQPAIPTTAVPAGERTVNSQVAFAWRYADKFLTTELVASDNCIMVSQHSRNNLAETTTNGGFDRVYYNYLPLTEGVTSTIFTLPKECKIITTAPRTASKGSTRRPYFVNGLLL